MLYYLIPLFLFIITVMSSQQSAKPVLAFELSEEEPIYPLSGDDLELAEKIFHQVDGPFFEYYRLVEAYSKQILQLMAFKENERRELLSVDEESSLIGLEACFQGFRKKMEIFWKQKKLSIIFYPKQNLL